MAPLHLFALFHLNLAFSSIEEELRPEVIRRCYWPLLRLAEELSLPFGIEATGFTLEELAALDPEWLEELRRLTSQGACEFVASGYAQVIGPLVPAEVNRANLRLGNTTYERLLGFRPRVALINEQCYSAGLLSHYVEAGYEAVLMEWDNPASAHPNWDPAWRHLPQRALGTGDSEIPLLWTNSVAFQKLQRYAHGEMEIEAYLAYLERQRTGAEGAFCIYANDAEIFDFRPGRYDTEAPLGTTSEWGRIGALFRALRAHEGYRLVRPSSVLELLGRPGSGNRLGLESPETPTPTKKQQKYNITRWAVTGRGDLGINTNCWRVYDGLVRAGAGDEAWRELCYLWSSDFRTHITDRRWEAYRKRLAEAVARWAVPPCGGGPSPASQNPPTRQTPPASRYLDVDTGPVSLRLDCRKGLSVESLRFPDVASEPLCGTLPHGFYDDIAWAADFYTGHLILEGPGAPKITDLVAVESNVERAEEWVSVSAVASTSLGPVTKIYRAFLGKPRLELEYRLGWAEIPLGSLRLGHVTLNPRAFGRGGLFFRTHNGGAVPETYPLGHARVDHGSAVSFLVSARQALGITEGVVEIGDSRHVLRITVDKTAAAVVGMITFEQVRGDYFLRLALSAGEMDDTSRNARPGTRQGDWTIRMAIEPVSTECSESRPPGGEEPGPLMRSVERQERFLDRERQT